MEPKDIKNLCYDAYLAGIDEADLGSPTMGTFAEWWQREKPAPTLSPTPPPDTLREDKTNVRCNHCMSVFNGIYITIDDNSGDEKCPVCGNKGALMNPFVPAPPSYTEQLKAIDAATEELKKLSPEEFRAKLKKHENGDIAKALQYAFHPDSTSTVTPVSDGHLIRCSECNHEIGYFQEREDAVTRRYYGPRCPGCGKLIDKGIPTPAQLGEINNDTEGGIIK